MIRRGLGSYDDSAGSRESREEETTEIECQIVAERDLAVAIWDGASMEELAPDPETGEIKSRRKWVWLPRSKIKIEQSGKNWLITMPEWLAEKKGLI